ncbi:MAG: hypothetical protein ACFB4J_03485, partial [Elainellaceae cyanobacterium]
DPGNCIPAIAFLGGDVNAWKRILRLDQQIYQNFCHTDIKRRIQVSAGQASSRAYRTRMGKGVQYQ